MRLALTVPFLALWLVSAAQAYPESDAAAVRVKEGGPDDVERVWHEPLVVAPGTQWQGYIRFRPNNTIEQVRVQICDVGRVCFAPPIPIQELDLDSTKELGQIQELQVLPDGATWTFNTTDYRDPGSGQPIKYEAGWRLGMNFILSERLANGSMKDTKFPSGQENPEDLEFHYFAFDMPPAAASRGAPTSLIAAALAVVGAALVRRRRHEMMRR